MNDQLIIFLETFFLTLLFLSSHVLSFGRKRNKQSTAISILCCALITTSLNNLFYDKSIQYFAYVCILLVISGIYSFFFVDAPLIYVISLQLNMFGCFTMIKRIIPSFLRLISKNIVLTQSLEILYYILYIIFILLACYFYITHALLPQIVQPKNYWLTILSIPAIILLMANIPVLSLNREDIYEDVLGLLSHVLMLFLLILSHYLSYLNINAYNDYLDTQSMNQRISLQLSQIQRSAALVEQIRRDKHEMKNVYFYIHTMLEENDIDGLKEFVNTKLLHRYDRLEEFHTGNETLDYLFSQKASEARALDIRFLADISAPPKITIHSDDLCALLLNLLDNAIEASKNVSNPDIQIIMKEEKNYLSITIKNRVETDILEENPFLKTTKKDWKNHGIGLRIVNSIVKKYNGMFSTSHQEGYFIANAFLQQSIND
ncbi:MAG: GHKL domain-containing protein [Lachnospiraceae bacterium]|nr:GHKL domain-containing protein [Lachnospiraceae bacterium]